MSCANQSGEWQGCRAFCLFEAANFGLENLFQTCTAPIDPGSVTMCAFHAKALNQKLDPSYSTALTSMMVYLQNDQEFQPEFFPLYTVLIGLPAPDMARLLLSPEFFWLLTPPVFAFVIHLGALPHAVAQRVPEAMTYVYVLDMLCEIMGWVMDGGEDVEMLGMTHDQLTTIKWTKLMICCANAFNSVMLTSTLFPPFAQGWEQAWLARVDHWARSVWQGNLSEDKIELARFLLARMVDALAAPAQHSRLPPPDPGLIAQLVE